MKLTKKRKQYFKNNTHTHFFDFVIYNVYIYDIHTYIQIIMTLHLCLFLPGSGWPTAANSARTWSSCPRGRHWRCRGRSRWWPFCVARSCNSAIAWKILWNIYGKVMEHMEFLWNIYGKVMEHMEHLWKTPKLMIYHHIPHVWWLFL